MNPAQAELRRRDDEDRARFAIEIQGWSLDEIRWATEAIRARRLDRFTPMEPANALGPVGRLLVDSGLWMDGEALDREIARLTAEGGAPDPDDHLEMTIEGAVPESIGQALEGLVEQMGES